MTSYIVTPSQTPLRGAIAVPGDKSIGHRALLFSALCSGEVEIVGLSGGQDNLRSRRVMEALGVPITERAGASGEPGPSVVVSGVSVEGLRAPEADLECGNSGTTMRLLTGLLAGQRFGARLVGDHSLSKRPMRRVIDPLTAMGASIDGQPSAKGDLLPPLVIRPTQAISGHDVTLAIASAQVKSAILLAGLYANGPVTVREPGPSRDHTERMLAHMGAPLTVPEPGLVRLDPRGWDRRLMADRIEVPGDPSSAAFLVVAGLIAGAREVAVTGVCVNPTRTGFLDVIAALGAEIERAHPRTATGEPVADLVVRHDRSAAGEGGLAGTVVAGDTVVRAIDEIPVLALLAARARGTTHIRDAGELRVKESDRIATTLAMLAAFGVSAGETPDGLWVEGRPSGRFRAAHIHAHGDHRIAMAAAVGALIGDGPTRIDDVDNVATSFPTFVAAVNQLANEPVITEVA